MARPAEREESHLDDGPKKTLRSQAWFGRQDKMGFYYRSFLKNQGTPQDQFDGKPVIGICNTWSELTPCNAHFRTIAEHVRYGVLEAGGFPLEFPVSSLGEVTMRPTAMLFRNLASMDVEEAIRAHPLDGVVLLMGCDKTTPALLMGAASADLPAIGVSGGPQLRGVYRGQIIGSGTNIISMSEQLRAGEITIEAFHEAEGAMNRSSGSCMTMGTASTMASMVEALGIGMPENAAIPAADARRNQLARLAGRRIVEMVHEDLKPSDILTRAAFENAIRTLAAIGGSTNAVVHLLAIAGRAGVDLTLDDFDRRRALPGRPDALGALPDGGFLLRGRSAGSAAHPRRAGAAAQGCAHRERSQPVGQRPRRRMLEPRGDHAIRGPVQAGGRHRDPHRQSRARRCGDQALRRFTRAAAAYRPRGGVRVGRGDAPRGRG